MDETLRQVGELLLGSIPTIIFMVLLYGIYSALVHKPLVKVLAERRSKTEGAIEKARADVAAAEARTAEYEQRLREARITVFKNQEALRQQALQARAAAVAEARNRAQAQVEQARAAIEKDKVAAQAGLEAESGKLAAEIIRIVLRPTMTQTPAGEGQGR
jgi:F-type H+-transporting ATPase subunit b